jgi:hypothetical protein
VGRLAGAPDQAAASLRAALRIYDDRRATRLAAQIRAALAAVAAQPGPQPGVTTRPTRPAGRHRPRWRAQAARVLPSTRP